MKLLFTLPLFLILCCGSPNIKTEEDTAVYTVNLPKKHEITKNDFHQVVTLDTLKTIHVLDFGVFTTVSTVALFRAEKPDSVLISQHLNEGERQLIDITPWGKGMYRVQFTAIAESCGFMLEIK